MKKLLFVLIAVLAMTFVGACQTTGGQTVQLDTPYEYTGVTFVRPKDITFEQAKTMISANEVSLGVINSIEDVEKHIANNLNIYSVIKLNEDGREIIHYAPLFKKVKFSDEKITFVVNNAGQEQEIPLGYEKFENKYVVSGEGVSLELFFEDGKIYYQKELLIEGYFIRYNHQIKK